MEHIDMVERLHTKAGISYSDAKDALERSGWDMLEALVLLENEGKIDPLTSFTTSSNDLTSYEKVTATASKKENSFQEALNKIGDQIKRLFSDSITTYFVVMRRGKEILRLQVIIALVLCLCLWKGVLSALVVGLICDCRYTIDSTRAKKDDPENKNDNDYE